MKKTEKTAMTAALFAAAMNLVPSGAVNTLTSNAEYEETGSYSNTFYSAVRMAAEDEDPTAVTTEAVYGPPIAWSTEPPVTTVAPNTTVPVYGPPVAWTTSPEPVVTEPIKTVPVPVYGPPMTDIMTTTVPRTTETSPVVPTVPVYGPPIAWKGDVNMDGSIDVFDMIELRNAYVTNSRSTQGDSYKMYLADVNNDGKVGMADMVMLQQYLLGKVKSFNDPLPETTETTTTNRRYSSEETTTTAVPPETNVNDVYGVYGPPPAWYDNE